MGPDLTILYHRIDRTGKELTLSLCCRIPGSAGRRIHLSAIFRASCCDRHFPATAVYEGEADGMAEYLAQVSIQLKDIFYDVRPLPSETVTLQIAYCDPQEQWTVSGVLLTLSGSLFQKEERKESVLHAAGRRCLYVLCTFLLPLWLLDGWLAARGYRTLHPAAAGRAGKSAYLYHAHGLVKGWTGYGYSVREYKTGYFRKCYEKACRDIPEVRGVLLLSERPVESGGNLDLVMRELDRQGCHYERFLTTKPVHRLDRRELRESARLIAGARLVILEDFFPQLHALSIRRETKILQMWHACGAFKLFGLSDLGIVDHLEQSSRNHRDYSAALASSRGVVPFYSEAFGIPEKYIRPIGIPRTDVFFDPSYGEHVRQRFLERYPVCRGKRIVLFAPTFRGSGNKTAYYPMDRFPAGWIVERLPEDAVLVVKHHPFVRVSMDIREDCRDRILDLSGRENVNDLLFVASVLVTDYSSVIFEAALLGLSMLFYVFDLQEYLAERDLYFDFAGFIPGKAVESAEDLVQEIVRLLEHDHIMGEEAAMRYEKFREFFLSALDGHSTERTMQLIGSMMGWD